MRKDHNLDDLIIDDIKPAKSRGKGILTIIALLITLLIAAIIMTRIFIGESDQNVTVIENDRDELISPELKLDTSERNPEAEKKELEQLSSMMEETLTDQKTEPEKRVEKAAPQAESQRKSVEKAPQASANTATIAREEPVKQAELKPETAVVDEQPQKKPAAPIIQTVEKPAVKPVVKPAAQTHKPKPKPAAPVKKPAAKGSYYIQVGSFTQRPSSRFLSIISNNGFHYVLKGGKLLIGPYSSDAAARRDLPRVKSKINKGAFVKHL